LDVGRYQKRWAGIISIDEAAKWERRYVAGAAAHVMLLGMWCLVAFIKTSDPDAGLHDRHLGAQFRQ